MKVINKQFRVPKIDDISTDYILKHFEGFDVIRWAVVDITDEFYIIDSAIIL